MNHDLKREANNFSFSDPILNSKFKLAKQTLNELIVNCDDYGVTFISIRSLALNTGKSNPTIQNHIEILESLGVLKTLDIKGNFGKKSHRQISFNVQVDVKPNVQVDVKPNVQVDVQVDVQATCTEDKIIQDKRIEGVNASAKATAKKSKIVHDYDSIMEGWNLFATDFDLSTIMLINDDRKKLIDKLFKVYSENTNEAIIDGLTIASNSKFLLGKSGVDFKITFDWFFKVANITKVLEGNYK